MMLIKVKFLKKSLYGEKDEVRAVTERAALQFKKLELAELLEELPEEKEPFEIKEEKQPFETKEEKKKPDKKVKITKSPR